MCDTIEARLPPDTNLLLCEDWEAETLHDDVGQSQAAPLWGPWDDEVAGQGYCSIITIAGCNSYFVQTHGQVDASCSIDGNHLFVAEWNAADRWGGNEIACVDILRDHEFDDEFPGEEQAPLIPGAMRGTFDGNQSFAHRVRAGRPDAVIAQDFALPGAPHDSIGYTLAIAYPSRFGTDDAATSVISGPWKHNSFSRQSDLVPDGWIGAGWNGSLPGPTFEVPDSFPGVFPLLRQRSISAEGWCGDSTCSPGPCNTCFNGFCALSKDQATIRSGDLECRDTAYHFTWDPDLYGWSEDWGPGQWRCVRSEVRNVTSDQMTVRVWFAGWDPSDPTREVAVVDVENLSGSILELGVSGFRGFVLNAFANANQPFGGTPTQEAVRRYEDNIVITDGNSVSCADIWPYRMGQ